MCTYQSPALKEAPSPLPVRPIPPPAYALCDPVDCHPHQLLSECSRLKSAAQHRYNSAAPHSYLSSKNIARTISLHEKPHLIPVLGIEMSTLTT